MTARLTLLLSPGLAFALLVASATAATLPSVPVTSCGQVVPAKTIGYLTADLDCTGYVGDLAVEIGKGSTLDLAGFTLTGGYNGVGCIAACAGGEGICTARCEIKNGTVQGAESTGILGDKLTLTGVTVRDNGLRGIDGNRVRISGSTITGSMIGVDGVLVDVTSSTITGNGSIGIVTTVRGRAKIHDSIVVDNDTSLVCAPPTAVTCFDIGSGKRPDVRRTSCKRSVRSAPGIGPCGDDSWCVCSQDGL